MKLKVTGSGSSGNNYILKSNTGRILLLDLGCNYSDILKSLNYNLMNIDGAIVTHVHSDHFKSAKDFEKFGLKVWKPFEEDKKIQTRTFGDFKVSCFDVPHDDTECRGFLIEADGEKLIYATDFEYIPYNFKKQRIEHMLIECNYMKEIVEVLDENASHVFKGHAELHTTLGIVKANATSNLRTVILCHLSKKNADAEKIINEVTKVVNKNVMVDVASKDKEWDFELPF